MVGTQRKTHLTHESEICGMIVSLQRFFFFLNEQKNFTRNFKQEAIKILSGLTFKLSFFPSKELTSPGPSQSIIFLFDLALFFDLNILEL